MDEAAKKPVSTRDANILTHEKSSGIKRHERSEETHMGSRCGVRRG